MFKTFFLIFFSTALFCEIKLSSPLRSGAAVLMDAETGKVLYEKNGEKVLPPASITKLASALYALQFGVDLDTKFRATTDCLVKQPKRVRVEREFSDPPYWLQTDGTQIYINDGEYLTFRDLLYAHFLCSANDASNVIAYGMTKNIPKFVEGMNEYLASIGCKNTHFCNPHGIFVPGHVSTPYDFAVIAKEALKYPIIRTITEELEHTIPKTNRSPLRYLRQSNFLLRPKSKFYYPFARGLKTGVHDEALYTLVAAADKNGRELISVIFQSPTYADRYLDAIDLFEAGFSEKKVSRTLFSAHQTFFSPNVKRAKKDVRGVIDEDVSFDYYPSIEPVIDARICWSDLQLPVKKGAELGRLDVVDEAGVVVKSVPIIADETPKGSWGFSVWKVLLFVLLGGALLGFGAGQLRKRFNR